MIRLRPHGDRDRGASMVEAAIVLPILVLLVFGIVEFGRAFNAQVTLTHAAREGVREYAINQDLAVAETVAVNAATSLDSSLMNVSATACDPGLPTTLTITYQFSYEIPFMGSNTANMTGKGVMRCGG